MSGNNSTGRIAVFSDIHGNLHALQAVLSAVDALGITKVFCGGDVVGYGGNPNECCELLRDRNIPTVPGNHDRREPFRRAFAVDGYLPRNGFLNFAVSCGPVRIIGLDSLVAGESHGELAAETLAFLEARFAEAPEAPTLVMLHHPPFETGIGHMDRTRLLAGTERLERELAANPQVKRLLCGHVHRSIQTMFGGTLCQIAPSVGHQVTLDLRAEAPSCFVLEPPAFLLHRFDGTGFVTHAAMVDRAPGPFPFILPDDYPGREAANRDQ